MPNYTLYTYTDSFVVEVVGEHKGNVLLISRPDGQIQLTTARSQQKENEKAFPQLIDGIIGAIELLSTRYLMVITSSKLVGKIEGKKIYCVEDTKIIPLNSDKKQIQKLTPHHRRDEQEYLAMLQNVLSCGAFYYSKHYDLTLSTQQLAEIQLDLSRSELAAWQRADVRFFWNRFASEFFKEQQAMDWITVLMNGYVCITQSKIKDQEIDFVLISRRSCRRTGKRFICRGLDKFGHAANFAETEQILYIKNQQRNTANVSKVISFLQTRGSIPLLWQQQCDLRYRPKIQLMTEPKATCLAFRRHFEDQIIRYGRHICLDLINQTGPESMLGQAYRTYADSLNHPAIRLIPWDFHHECKGMKFEKTAKLVNLVENEFKNMNIYLAQHKSQGKTVIRNPTRKQRCIFRTNCMDCLDRTNVVQSVLGRRALEDALQSIGVLDSSDRQHFGNSADFEHVFKNTWANNADAMSKQYSGTGALKTDYTRTGKRTFAGKLQDGKNSIKRYIFGQFYDGFNQDSLDLFLGHYIPSTLKPSPFDENKSSRTRTRNANLYNFLLRVIAVFITLAMIGKALGLDSYLWLNATNDSNDNTNNTNSITLKAFSFSSFFSSFSSFSSSSSSLSSGYELLLYLLGAIIIGSLTGAKLAFKKGRSFVNKPRLRLHEHPQELVETGI